MVNCSDTLHFLSFNRVKPGTTDEDISNYFNNPQSGPPSFVLPTAFGTDVLSPGQRQLLWYSAPKGTYAELRFVPDDKTGMPHAFMGMHKVVKL